MAKTDTEVFWGTGRRKTAVARVRMRRGTGRILVNDRDVDTYFPTERAKANVRAPLKDNLRSAFDMGNELFRKMLDHGHTFTAGIEREFADSVSRFHRVQAGLAGSDHQGRLGRLADFMPALLVFDKMSVIATQPGLQ